MIMKLKLFSKTTLATSITAVFSLMSFNNASAAQTMLYSSKNLSGISNAVLCNGDIQVAFSEEVGHPADYPDASKFSNLKLLTGNKAQSVDASGFADVAAASSLGCDSLNRVHLAYQKWAGFSYAFDSPYIVFKDGKVVENQLIFDDANWGWHTSLDLDSDNKAHVIQFGHAGYFLNYSTNASKIWTNDDISGSGIYYGYPSIAVDSTNNSHVIAFATESHALSHWFEERANSWSSEQIATDAASVGNLIFDPRATNVAYSIYITTKGEVILLTQKDGVWSKEKIATGTAEDIGNMIGVAVSPKGQIYATVQNKAEVRLYTKLKDKWVYYTVGIYTKPSNVSRILSKPPSILFGNGGAIVVYSSGNKIMKATLDGLTAKTAN
jgi:hypothetical protein